LPPDTVWFDFMSETPVPVAAPNGGGVVTVDTPIDVIPAFQRAGSILPLKTRVRRCSALMKGDPITLRIALNQDGAASGSVYLDDEDSFGCVTTASTMCLPSWC